MIITGLSGNEWYCLHEKGLAPGRLVVGNSVLSLGVVRSLTSGVKMLAGGEIGAMTELVSQGRHAAVDRLVQESREVQADGVAGVSSTLRTVGGGLQEFLAIGSAVHSVGEQREYFSTACSGQDLYCQMDAGYRPIRFVIGNVCYALGVGRGITSFVRGMAGGEIVELSNLVNKTRHLALDRIEAEAREAGANAIVDITIRILSFGPGVREMLLVGTASHHPALGTPAVPATSELTGDELWNLTQRGYVPMRLLLASSVYSIGIGGSVMALFRSLAKGEVGNMTRLVYQARENCLAHIDAEAKQIGADAVVDTKLFINEFAAGFIEVMAIGTAIRKHSDVSCASPQLIPQAIIRDRDTYFDESRLLATVKTS